ncbi:hypothetical protein EIN_381100 [Entamoeba invadens IP1]|uniref:MRN complex-interacting protein N-terminal domain-containing protein n=1 Tax=Entamoeba invadens IP1 TaxID=370355 RepID=A0A0A1UAP7_ENTIV|nr:hypothetical protein EIN_381100 [Entamoeba invadens IP1]ELP92153.1 hypothetical protein EIN_381100 [Entamoeba invadens IP1]|eukprot:XP_004258924.1 hypothetical protein EIN_381100 [Entamoeba invadens IP1]
MPQEFVLLQCFECCSFQVHIKNKTKKFACKMCGAKQSYRHIFGISNQAKDLRLLCGKYNSERITKEEQETREKGEQYLMAQNELENETEYNSSELFEEKKSTPSLWEKFNEPETDDGGLIHPTTPLQIEKRSKLIRKEKIEPITLKDTKPPIAPKDVDNLLGLFNTSNSSKSKVKPTHCKLKVQSPKDDDYDIDDLMDLFEEHITKEPTKSEAKPIKQSTHQISKIEDKKNNSKKETQKASTDHHTLTPTLLKTKPSISFAALLKKETQNKKEETDHFLFVQEDPLTPQNTHKTGSAWDDF